MKMQDNSQMLRELYVFVLRCIIYHAALAVPQIWGSIGHIFKSNKNYFLKEFSGFTLSENLKC